ncbi:MAG: nucleotidyl transferase AbiEii/AbiGii toxin family protein [Deltaproteobacteria bacterium]|nr:nucleotidyl transferase AbiEii/AbiGii toxin family protein [Deltaproteobacteria bacterium]
MTLISYIDLFHVLNLNHVRYMLVGGLAVNLYGIERATGDIDLVVDLTEENVLRFSTAMKKLGMRPRIPVTIEDFGNPELRKTWIEEKGMMVFSLFHPQQHHLQLDVFVTSPFDFDAVYKERELMGHGEKEISVVPIKTLIAMKQQADRPQDRADVYHLEKIRTN